MPDDDPMILGSRHPISKYLNLARKRESASHMLSFNESIIDNNKRPST